MGSWSREDTRDYTANPISKAHGWGQRRKRVAYDPGKVSMDIYNKFTHLSSHS